MIMILIILYNLSINHSKINKSLLKPTNKKISHKAARPNKKLFQDN